MNENLGYFNYMNLSDYVNKKNIRGASLRYLKELVDMGTSMFMYEDLPFPLTSQIIEMALMFNTHLCFYQNDAFGPEPMLCRYIPNGQMNKYWKPTKVTVMALNGEHIADEVNYTDIILARDNVLDIPLFIVLDDFIEKIQHMEDTLDVNMQLLKMPMIFTCDKKQTATYKQLFKSIKNCEPFVLAASDFNADAKSIPISLPVSPKDIYEIYDKYRNMAREALGISATIEKAQRVQAAEVEAQNDYVNFVYNERKEQRMEFIKLLNDKYGYNIKLVEAYDQFKREDAELNAQKQVIIDNAKENGGGTNE